MRIAIDLNDVIRDYTSNFINCYNVAFNKDFNINDIETETNRMYEILDFINEEEYQNFTYTDYVWELYAKCDTVDEKFKSTFNLWLKNTLSNLDLDTPIDILFVSPMEYELTIQSTYFFLSKIGTRVREVHFPTNSQEIWDKCDALVTANPELIKNQPLNKLSVKINTFYNKHVEGDFNYDNIIDFMESTKQETSLIQKLIE